MSQNDVNIQLTGKQKRNMRRRLVREKRAMEANASQNTDLVNDNQSQPLNVYPDTSDVWAPNMAMQSMQQDPGLYPQTNPWNSTPESLPGQTNLSIRRTLLKEQRAMEANASQNTVLVDHNQSQPLNVYPDNPSNLWAPQNTGLVNHNQSQPLNVYPDYTSDVWAPNLAMQSMQQDPGLYPQTNPWNNTPDFGPWTDLGNSLQHNYDEAFPHENYNMGTQPVANQANQVNQGKKMKNKLKPKQQPKKKLKAEAELSFEEKQKREAELREIEKKFRLAVMMQRSIQAPAKPPPKKTKAKVTPLQQAPVRAVVPIATVTPTAPGPSLQPPEPIKEKRRLRRGKKNKKNQNWNANLYKSGAPSTSQYQAPHQDEPEDLTDDLAPNMAGGQRQPGAQPRAVTAENKLNFKFQRSVPKNPDWSEYQNKFRRFGGDSPEPPADADADKVKQEPNQPITTGFIFDDDVEMKEVTIEATIDTSELRVAVTTAPYHYLTEDQVKEMDEALVNKVQDAIFSHHQSYVPTFEDIPVHNLGHLPLNCRSPKDLIWLHETLSAIPTPTPDVKLVILPQTAMPNMVKVKLFLPNYSGNLEELRYLLQKQNQWYDMSSWMLVKSEKQGDDPSNYYLEYRVPEKQALIIDNRDRRVAYSLGTCFALVADDTIDTAKVFKHRNVAKHLQVCVLTEQFRYLTLLEVELIKLALIYKLEKGMYSENEYTPTFRGCPSHYKGGLKMWCESDRDLKWLKDAVNSLVSPAIGTKLTIIEQGAIPQRAKMTVVVPTAEDESFIIKVLKSQNGWCDLDSWTLFSTWLDPRSNVVCVFYIPHKHIRLIKDRNCRLSFLLGYVKVDITTE